MSPVIANGEAGRRMRNWRRQDQLGGATLLRSDVPGTDEWTLESDFSRKYDGADRLTQVQRGSAPSHARSSHVSRSGV